jgi:hypothetical protein
MESQKEFENIEPSVRRVRLSYYGYMNPTSIDTGEKVGMTKQMACTASISSNISGNTNGHK